LTSIRLPGAITDSMRYDLEGRLVWRNESGPAAGVLHAETMQYDARGKLVQANNGSSQFTNWYSGMGTLVGTDWSNLTQNVGRIAEELQTDPLGSTGLRRTNVGMDATGGFARFQNMYQPGTGRLLFSRRAPPSHPSSDFEQDSTGRAYDAGGNVTRGYQRVGQSVNGVIQVGREVETRNYYGADDRLRVLQKLEIRDGEAGVAGYETAGVWEEYRYDALGRRVMVRTRMDSSLCNYETWGCTPSTTTFVWAGDQLLWELKSASGTHASAAGGNVSYFHAGGIDRPLVITKGSTSIVPHQNWRGQFARGTYADGTKSDCPPGVTTGCTPVAWPGERTTARHERESGGEIRNWFGGLVDGMRDASGQMYMRNRYYDPQTGQFTQSDPIGLAGGLNAYGFANGDPVTYSDPYGLRPDDVIVGCRSVDNTRGLGGHCSVRIVNEKLNIDVTYEVLSNGIGEPQFAGQTSPQQAARYEGRGVQVAVPNGMTSDEFDMRVLENAERISQERNGQNYSPSGTRNSNRFVYDVITQSGGKVPWAAVPYNKATPGICGGKGILLGTDCSGSRSEGSSGPRKQ
ncbi:MAG TPA: RHS repeat-associated core domain-containing protein, partial [Longimicrobium sp.]|nr:RHS repeat-associated core domain-containing protein [Longimicrobium sp.]